VKEGVGEMAVQMFLLAADFEHPQLKTLPKTIVKILDCRSRRKEVFILGNEGIVEVSMTSHSNYFILVKAMKGMIVLKKQQWLFLKRMLIFSHLLFVEGQGN
jgi:hypothetical protein